MTLNDVLNIKAWTPLRSVAKDLVEVLPGVFAVSDSVYLQTQLYDAQLEHGHAEAPFITLAYWASSPAALRRLVTADASISVPPAPVPPPAMALGTDGTYRQLAETIPRARMKIAETATYNNKGHFLFKHIVLPPFDFHFPTPDIPPKERTCLIAARLQK